MGKKLLDFWNYDTSVLIRSFDVWQPEKWGMLTWSRENALDKWTSTLSNPFIGLIYMTEKAKKYDQGHLVGKIAGFFLMSHEKGSQNDFCDPSERSDGENLHYALKATRAFTYSEDHLRDIRYLYPRLNKVHREIAFRGLQVTNHNKIAKLRKIPCEKVRADLFANQAKNK